MCASSTYTAILPTSVCIGAGLDDCFVLGLVFSVRLLYTALAAAASLALTHPF